MRSKLLFAFAILLFAASCGEKGTGTEPGPEPPGPGPEPEPTGIELDAKEMRAVWVATTFGIDWPMGIYDEAGQKKLYTDYLDRFVELNINTVFMQVRPNADAFYDSPYEPWSKWITGPSSNLPGTDPGYDVLGFMVEEAHARGLEFHAWMNPFRIVTGSAGVFQPLNEKINPAWVKSYTTIQVYNPALPEVRQRLADIVKDMITKYDVDGIHFDDYFYPSPGTYSSLDDEEDYKMYGKEYANITDFRFANVDKMVKLIYETIDTNNPGVVFSVSPMSDNGANAGLFADPTRWCEDGIVDVIIPQIYSSTTASGSTNFGTRASWWNQFSYKAVPMVGYAIYKFDPNENATGFDSASELVNQFKRARSLSKIRGSVLYSAKYLNSNPKGIVDVIKSTIYPRPAVIPFLGRKTVADPAVATGVAVTGGKLTWSTAADLRTVIYKVDNDKGLVVAILDKDTKEYTLPDKGDYCVTTLNVDNAESAISEIVTY
jgi:uncharacterized lipoprotein YddW (UPF0748 family)